MRRISWSLLVLVFLLIGVSARAQHAGFVLFGDPTPEAAEVPAEQQHVHPLTSPYFNEDAFVTTDIRAWYVYHDFPQSSLIGGGNADVFAVQARLALTNRLQLLAVKDGWINFDTGLIDDSGWNDIAAGLKYNLIQDWDNQLHVSVGAGYELKTGNGKVLQNDDEARLFVSFNKGFDKLHIGANVNYFWRVDDQDALGDSDRLQWHIHIDYAVCKGFNPVVEFNGYHILDAGSSALPFHGVDVGNFGTGEDDPVVTIGLGAQVGLTDDIAVRAAYETPLTKNDDLFGYRWTFSLVWSF